MKVNVFDSYIVIKDRDGHPYMDESLVEKDWKLLLNCIIIRVMKWPLVSSTCCLIKRIARHPMRGFRNQW